MECEKHTLNLVEEQSVQPAIAMRKGSGLRLTNTLSLNKDSKNSEGSEIKTV